MFAVEGDTQQSIREFTADMINECIELSCLASNIQLIL